MPGERIALKQLRMWQQNC